MGKLSTILILAIILVPTIVLMNHYFNPPDYGGDYVRVGKVNIHFGSNISDCMAVPIDPSAASDLVNAKQFVTLFDPDGSEKYALATYEVSRILFPLGHTPYAAYTKPYKNETGSIRSLSEGTPSLPIILFEIGDETSVTRLLPGQITVSGVDDVAINQAACRLDLEILKIVYRIKLPE